MAKFNLIRKGNNLLAQSCNPVIFPLSEDIYDCIDECKNTLRNVDGFWKEKGMSIAAP
jgi:peptide deformylase